MIPDWMREVDVGPCQCSAVYHGKKGFVGKTIDGIFGFLEEAFVSESNSRRRGLLQSLDPRAKLISILAVIFATSLIGNLRVSDIHLCTHAHICVSQQDRSRLLHKKGLALHTHICGHYRLTHDLQHLPSRRSSLFRWHTSDRELTWDPSSLPESIFITQQGLNAAVIFTMRVATCVSAVVLLFITTPQQVLFKSLRTVGVPKIYVLTLEMAYRYIFLLMDLVRELYVAKKARTIRARGMFDEQKWVGGRMGYTLIRSLDMSEKVHMAMMSRGFSGEVHIMQEFKMQNRDYIAGIAAITLSVVLVLISENIIRV